MPVKPIPPTPSGYCAAYIEQKNYALHAHRGKHENADAHYAKQQGPLPPPRFHAVKNDGKTLNYTLLDGPRLSDVQATSMCGITPDPFNSTILNRIARRQAIWRADGGIDGIDRRPAGMAPKFWVQEPRTTVVSCPRCLALMRKAARPRLRYRPLKTPATVVEHQE
jgi:hypothetical protein